MKKWLFLILALSIFLSACSEQNLITGATAVREVIRCGDGYCDDSEDCDCLDCENDQRCFVPVSITEEIVKEVCDETKENCCGNNKCEDGERCNLEKLETICPEDCVLECPSKLIIGDPRDDQIFYCLGDCDFYEERFTIRGNSEIRAVIKNIGEKASNIVNSNFNCYTKDEVFTKKDGGKAYGITVRDYFNDHEERVDSINSKVSGNNFANYVFEVNVDEIKESRDVTCVVTISSTPELKQTHYLKMKVLK